jgi:hypothetical protein
VTRGSFLVPLFLLLLVVGGGSAGGAGSSVRGVSGGSIIYVSDRTGNHGEVDAIDPRGTRIRQLVRDVDEAAWSPGRMASREPDGLTPFRGSLVLPAVSSLAVMRRVGAGVGELSGV